MMMYGEFDMRDPEMYFLTLGINQFEQLIILFRLVLSFDLGFFP